MMYLKIGLFVAIFFGGWVTNGWRLDSKQNDALKSQRKEFNKQREKDLEQYDLDLAANVKIKKVFIKVKEDIENVPDTPDDQCTVDVAYKRVWNRAVRAIGESVTNSLHDPLRNTIIHENKQYRLQGSSEGSIKAAWGIYEHSNRMY